MRLGKVVFLTVRLPIFYCTSCSFCCNNFLTIFEPKAVGCCCIAKKNASRIAMQALQFCVHELGKLCNMTNLYIVLVSILWVRRAKLCYVHFLNLDSAHVEKRTEQPQLLKKKEYILVDSPSFQKRTGPTAGRNIATSKYWNLLFIKTWLNGPVKAALQCWIIVYLKQRYLITIRDNRTTHSILNYRSF